MYKIILIGFLFLSNLMAYSSSKILSKKPCVLYVIPRSLDDPFYQRTYAFLKEASTDLEVELHLLELKENHFIAAELVEKKLEKINKRVDAIITVNVKKSAHRILKLAETKEIYFFVEDALIQEKIEGKDKEDFSFYLGEMTPNSFDISYSLLKKLYEHSKVKIREDRKVRMIGLLGPHGTTASSDREKGMRKALSELEGKIEVLQIVRADWERDLARAKFSALSKRYNNVDIVWAANDVMALGVNDYLKANPSNFKVRPLITGVDWVDETLDRIEKEEILASGGGHFMEAAWSLVLIHDFLKGYDFRKRKKNSFLTNMAIITKDNLKNYRTFLNQENWHKVDFKRFSKIYNKSLNTYDFNIEKVFDQLQDLKI